MPSIFLSFFLICLPSFFFASLSYFPSFLCKAFSRDQSSFFGSGEIEKKLVFEVNRLKAKLASKQVELEGEHHDCQISEQALRAQVVESEQRKNDALTALKEALEKSDDFKRDYEDT
jgi:hypothetical protein